MKQTIPIENLWMSLTVQQIVNSEFVLMHWRVQIYQWPVIYTARPQKKKIIRVFRIKLCIYIQTGIIELKSLCMLIAYMYI